MPRSLRTASLALPVVAALLIVGCSSGASDQPTDDSETSASGLSGTISVAAAASLEPAFRELAARFTEANPGVTVENLTFDGSSTLAEQILAGAPYDVFASADENNMAKVEDEGLTDGSSAGFATSSLEIAVAPGNPFGIETLADLTQPGPDGALPLVVVCAPEVPCGAAAHTLLDRDGVALSPESEEQNVTAVLTKVVEGEADAGLVYRSDILRSDGGAEGIEIEGSIEAAGTYMIATLMGAASPEASRAFVEFVQSDEARELLDELGFGPV